MHTSCSTGLHMQTKLARPRLGFAPMKNFYPFEKTEMTSLLNLRFLLSPILTMMHHALHVLDASGLTNI